MKDKKLFSSYKEIVESSTVAMLFDNEDGKFEFINKRFSELFGYSKEEILQLEEWDLIHPDDREMIKQYHSDRIKGNKIIDEYDFRGIHKNRDTLYLRTSVIPRKNENGEIVGTLSYIWDISKSEQIKKILIEKERQIQAIYNDPETFIGILDVEGNVLSANESALNFIGKKLDDIKGFKFWETPWWTHSEELQKKLQISIADSKKGKSTTFNADHVSAKGNKQYVRFTVRPIKNEKDETYQLLVEGINITDQVEAEEKLKQSELRYRNVLEHSNLIYYIQDKDNNLTYVSPQCNDIMGYDQEEMKVNWTMLASDNPINESGFESTIKALKTGKRQKPYILEVIRKDKQKILIKVSESPLKDASGEVIGLTGSVEDVTEKMDVEKALRSSEKKFRTVLENIHLIGVMLDPAANIIFANDYLLNKTGWNRNEIVGGNWFDIFTEKKYSEKIKQRYNEILQAGKVSKTNRVNQIVTKDGKKLTIKWSSMAHFDSDNNITSVTSIGEDITRQIETESDLRFQSELIKQSHESIITTDTDFKISWVNEAFTKLFGYSSNEVVGKSPDFLNAEVLADEIQKGIYESLKKGRLIKTTLWNRRKDGSKFICELSVYPVRDENGDIIAYSGHQLDVTSEKEAQAALTKSEEKYRELFENQIEAYAYHEIILDKKGNPVDYRFIDVNDQFLKELNFKKKSDVIGKTLLELLPNTEKSWIEIYGEVAITGEPKILEQYASELQKYFKVSVYSPKIGFFATSFIDITKRKLAEKELNKYKDQLEDLIDERTSELQKKNEELDNALKVFVGRELTIKQLENRISELENRNK